MQARFLGREDPLEKGTATHSSILAWRILWTVETGGLQSIGSQRLNQLSKKKKKKNPTTLIPWKEKIISSKIKIFKEPHARWDFGFVLRVLFGVEKTGFE